MHRVHGRYALSVTIEQVLQIIVLKPTTRQPGLVKMTLVWCQKVHIYEAGLASRRRHRDK